MKIVLSLLLILLLQNPLSAQHDYSGVYGSTSKEKNKYLTVMRIDATHYKFWAMVSSKNYANNLDGIIEIKGDSIQYDYTEGSKVCPIHFKFSPTYAVVYPEANSECSFTFGKNIFATYMFIKKQK